MNARTWKKLGACLCAGALVAALCAGCASKASDDAAQPLVNGVTDRQEVVYCLYFGLTDKDTGKQELTMDEAKDIAIPLFIEAGSGYTVYEAEGGFAKEDGTVVQNDTLVFDSTHGDERPYREGQAGAQRRERVLRVQARRLPDTRRRHIGRLVSGGSSAANAACCCGRRSRKNHRLFAV